MTALPQAVPLRAWEHHELEPTEVEFAYLRLIEREPELARIRAMEPAC